MIDPPSGRRKGWDYSSGLPHDVTNNTFDSLVQTGLFLHDNPDCWLPKK
jgi:hypothetical protein